MSRISTFLLILLCLNAAAQNYAELDSVNRAIRRVDGDYHDLVFFFEQVFYKTLGGRPVEEARKSAAYVIDFCRENDLKRPLILALQNMGKVYEKAGLVTEAYGYFYDAIDLAQRDNDQESLAQAYEQLGHFQEHRYLFDEGLKNILLAARIAENIGDTAYHYRLLGAAMSIEFQSGNYQGATERGQKLLSLYDKLGKSHRSEDMLRSFMTTYNSVAFGYSHLEQYDSAIKNYDRAEQIARRLGDEFWIGLIGGNKATDHMKLGRYSEALPYLLTDYRTSKKYEQWGSAINCTVALAELYLYKNDLGTAMAYLDSCIQLSRRHGDGVMPVPYWQVFADVEFARGHYAASHDAQKRYTRERLEAIRKQESANVAKVQSAFDLERKQNEIEKLTTEGQIREERFKRQRILFTGTIVVLALVGALAINLVRSFKRQKKITALVRQQYIEIDEKNKMLASHQREIETQNKNLESALEELRTTQEQLVHSEKMSSLGQLTAGIVHEINNPITFVQSGAEALTDTLRLLRKVLDEYDRTGSANFQDQLPHIEKIKKEVDYDNLITEIQGLVRTIDSGARRTAAIVSGLQRFSRKGMEGVARMLIADAIEETLLLMQRELKDRIVVEKDFAPGLAVECRTVEMGQVFMNILMNAAQAIGGRGKISIRTKLGKNDHAEIMIADDGVGIPGSNLSKIFDPFYTTKEVGKGTGLGLSVTHGIIVAHHGEISVASTPGRGTQFLIRIPLKQPTDDKRTG